MALALAGGLVGLCWVALHQRWPLLVLGAAACLTTLAALPRGWWARPAFAAGVAVVVGLATVPRAEGDYLVAADPQGYTLLALTLVLVVAGAVTAPAGAGRAGRA